VSDPTPAIAPYVPTYATYTPYISTTEFENANTGVDTSQLVPGGTADQQQAALIDLLARASSEADRICRKPLAATTDIQSGEYRIFHDSTIRVPVDYKPIVAVTQVLVGHRMDALTALPYLGGLAIGPKVVRVPVRRGVGPLLSFSPNPAAYANSGHLFAQVTYVNGWAHTILGADADAADTSIDPASVVGFTPGLPFTIKDGASTENAVVDASYVYGSATVPLAAPLQYAHSAGATVSALPPFVKNAVIDLAKALRKASGSKAIVMGAINGQKVTGTPKTQKTDPGGDEDLARAEKALLTLRRSA
jgi:hypothetical protein